jgi:hypothetical protein
VRGLVRTGETLSSLFCIACEKALPKNYKRIAKARRQQLLIYRLSVLDVWKIVKVEEIVMGSIGCRLGHCCSCEVL